MLIDAACLRSGCPASMGPGSDNPGYGLANRLANGHDSASMGPGSDNPGYAYSFARTPRPGRWLQWVRGRITPVMVFAGPCTQQQFEASMGPGSDNPGYASLPGVLPRSD